jgi:hypothetical protein
MQTYGGVEVQLHVFLTSVLKVPVHTGMKLLSYSTGIINMFYFCCNINIII